MLFSIALLIVVVFLSYKAAPRERAEHALVHGAGQIGLLAAVALFGMDYFTSFFYGTGELMGALHPYGLQKYGYIAAGVIALANFVFGALYMYSLGIFNEGGGSYTASMRYLKPTLSLIVAVTLIEDYVLTIVVSALSGGDQLLSVLRLYGKYWWLHFGIGALLATATWYITIRGRGESSTVAFTLLGVFAMLTVTMAIGLFIAHFKGIPPVPPTEVPKPATLLQAMMHILTASMKGMVALSGLEAMSNGIQFVINEDVRLVKWGKEHLPRFNGLWNFYGGKSGIGRFVQTSFLFYGGLTTFFLTFFAMRFDVFDGTLGRSLVGNLSHIAFSQVPGGIILFWTYQILAVILLGAASMTALQDAQATEWRDVAIGEIPEIIIYRDRRGTFTRSVTITYIVAVLIMLLVRGRTTVAAPFYGVGVFMPIMIMGLAIRQHIRQHYSERIRAWGAAGAGLAAAMAGTVFVGQIVGKWEEGGWVRLITFTTLFTSAHLVLLSPVGYRTPEQIHRIVRQKARVQGAMASIVEWQSLKMQEYRYTLLVGIARFFELFGVRRPVRYEPPPFAGDYDHALHVDHPEAPSFLEQYLTTPPTLEGAGEGLGEQMADPSLALRTNLLASVQPVQAAVPNPQTTEQPAETTAPELHVSEQPAEITETEAPLPSQADAQGEQGVESAEEPDVASDVTTQAVIASRSPEQGEGEAKQSPSRKEEIASSPKPVLSEAEGTLLAMTRTEPLPSDAD